LCLENFGSARFVLQRRYFPNINVTLTRLNNYSFVGAGLDTFDIVAERVNVTVDAGDDDRTVNVTGIRNINRRKDTARFTCVKFFALLPWAHGRI